MKSISKNLHFFVPWREPHRLLFLVVFVSVWMLAGRHGLSLVVEEMAYVLPYGSAGLTSLLVEMYTRRTSEKRAAE